jgi:hypothetical protein
VPFRGRRLQLRGGSQRSPSDGWPEAWTWGGISGSISTSPYWLMPEVRAGIRSDRLTETDEVVRRLS